MSAVAAAPPPVYLGRPPELWERAGAAYRAWWARHPGLARGLGRMVWACYLVAIPLFLLALLVIPRLTAAKVPGLFAAFGSRACWRPSWAGPGSPAPRTRGRWAATRTGAGP